ncbi:MAG: nucleoside-diphosphate kinase [Deltaproteobacteria bacterium]|jgi:nucleoside-diphosphate kinase|nr:nucleoside-diphosphate kinase [Deltaproteobacteria bacterium]MBW2372504.1 nucleoside-diphosphate kinase [Deltaproteobacteria bacterium]
MALERTLSIVKPDAVEKGVAAQILARIEASGLKIIALKMIQLTPEEAQGFYAVHKERPFYGELVAFMTSGPVVVSALEGDNAIARYRELMGATNPADAADGTIRKEFATDIEKNAVHGSDGPDTSKIEIAYFFNATEIQAPVEAL